MNDNKAPAFVSSLPVAAAPLAPAVAPSTCSRFLSTPTPATAAAPKKAAALPNVTVTMQQGDRIDPDAYQIQQSEFVDPEGDDDSGDGFIGEEDDMDNHLGITMPDDLASFERKEIQNAATRDDLVDILRDIRDRRRDILDDRRKGLGMENANDYLRNL